MWQSALNLLDSALFYLQEDNDDLSDSENESDCTNTIKNNTVSYRACVQENKQKKESKLQARVAAEAQAQAELQSAFTSTKSNQGWLSFFAKAFGDSNT